VLLYVASATNSLCVAEGKMPQEVGVSANVIYCFSDKFSHCRWRAATCVGAAWEPQLGVGVAFFVFFFLFIILLCFFFLFLLFIHKSFFYFSIFIFSSCFSFYLYFLSNIIFAVSFLFFNLYSSFLFYFLFHFYFSFLFLYSFFTSYYIFCFCFHFLYSSFLIFFLSLILLKENKIDVINHMQHWLKLKKIYNHKPNMKLNSDRTIGFLTIKTLKQDLTWLYFDKLYFIRTVVYFVIARTKWMKWQNKWEQLSEQV
jgi:hypothetical protein